MTTKVTEISKEALQPVVAARSKAVDLAKAAEDAMKDARLAEMEFKVQIQQLYLEKGLHPDCRVDITNGNVTWPEQKPEVVESPKKRTSKKKDSESVPTARERLAGLVSSLKESEPVDTTEGEEIAE
jgi:hypothetical protein